MEKIYVVSLIGDAVWGGRSVHGFMETFDLDHIKQHIKEHNNLELGEQYPNKYDFQNGCHWEYATNFKSCDVHVDVIYRMK